MLRRFPEALAEADRVLAWEPTNVGALSTKAEVFLATGDLQAAEALLLTNPQVDPPFLRAVCPLFQRRYAAAIEILSRALPTETDRNARNIEKLLLGLSQQRAGDVAAARATYQSAAQDIQRGLGEGSAGFFCTRRERMPVWVWPMQVWAKRPLLSPKDKKLWLYIPLPKIQ